MEALQAAVEVLVWVGGPPYKEEAVEEVALNVRLRPFFLLG